MNWQAVSFDWNQVRAFLATVEEGSFSAAARALGLTQPTLGRQVTALEEHLGVPLFERVGRSVELTPSGLELVDHVRAMGEAATQLSLVASGQSQSVDGVVKVSATEMYAAYVMPEVVQILRDRHAGIVIEVIATNALSDLRRREADIAIRNAEPTDPDMIARRIRSDQGGLYATPELAERYGPFSALQDLKDVPFVGFGNNDQFLKGLQAYQVPVSPTNFVTMSENHYVHWQMAQKGIGIGVNGFVIGDATPNMQRVLPEFVTFDFPVWLVAPRELRTSRRVRIVWDILAEVLSHHKDGSNSA